MRGRRRKIPSMRRSFMAETPAAGERALWWTRFPMYCTRFVLKARYSSMRNATSHAVATKVSESLFVKTLRGYIDSLPPRHLGWLAGLRDPQVGKCLDLMHSDPAKDWSVERLAERVHVSRSVLAQRFNELVGVPPIQYLKRWRLAIAARLLRSERISLNRVTARPSAMNQKLRLAGHSRKSLVFHQGTGAAERSRINAC